MKLDKSGIGYRILVPIFILVLVITIGLLGLIQSISARVQEDYFRFAVTSAGNNAFMALELAASELIAAKLTSNPVVIEAKKRAVLDTIVRFWTQGKQEGIISTTEGSVLFSTLPPKETAEIIALPLDGYHVVEGVEGHHHCFTNSFPLWGWTVTTVVPHSASHIARVEVLLLAPIVALGAFLIIGGLFVILRRNLQHPVATMVQAVTAGGEIPLTGVAEFDHVGAAVNDALGKVRKKEREIHQLLDSTAEGIYGVDPRGNCTFCNPSCLRMLGYEREEELLGKNTHRLFHHTRADGQALPEADCRIYQAYQKNTGIHVDDEVFWRKDGSSFPVEYWSYPVIEKGAVTGTVVAFVDITERKKADSSLREEKNKIEAIIAAMGEGLSIQDRDFRVLYQNDVHKGFVGAHAGELCYQAYESSDKQCDGCPIASAFKDGSVHTVERIVDLPGGTKSFEITASPLRNAQGEIVAGIELVRDVTERKRTEQQLQQAQKMEAIGQLAGGVAHDFNNILTAITGYASFLKVKTEEGSQLRYYGEQILTAAEKAGNLTRQILAFSRKQVIKPRPVNVNESIRGMEKMMFRLLGEDIEVRTVLTDRDATVMADPGQFEQVLLNLATNARDAMPAGGSLHVSTEVVELNNEAAHSKGLKVPGKYVLISFSDTGEGMSQKVRQRIFEPFFTTKEMGRGTGLGLSIVYGIVTQHEGQINVYSEPGEGTSFRIYLPLVTGHQVRPAASKETTYKGKGETILIAEDDETVRNIARLTLEEAGYRVITAVDGEDAVARFREQPDSIQLCLFDLIMPKKTGKAALEAIRSLRPDVPALFMSGYAADIIKSKDLAEIDVEVMDKPLVPRELQRRVRETLDGSPGPGKN
ncbi:MAG: PAS domain S-box protein [Nitrospirota bacterium]|nr:PAS domain S-box protein [Nitrospirota bacterium]